MRQIIRSGWKRVAVAGLAMATCLVFSWPIAAQNQVSLGSVSITRGGTANLPISITTNPAQPSAGINLVVLLPPGISFTGVVTPNTAMIPAGFSTRAQALPGNQVAVLVYSQSVNASSMFLSTSGKIVDLRIQATAGAPTGVFPVSIVESRRRDIEGVEMTVPRGVSTPTGESISHSLANANILITSAGGTNLIPDPGLNAAVRAALGFDPGATIEASELAGLTSLFVGRRNVSNLSGLEFATNLTSLNLEGNSVRQLGELSGLTHLTTLNLNDNLITDLQPLSGLTNLMELDLDFNSISDLSPLATLTNLRTLTLTGNSIAELSPMSGLVALRELRLDGNRISNVTPLGFLINLTVLMLDFNPLAYIGALSANAGLGAGDVVTLEHTLLDSGACTAIAILESRGVTVSHNVDSCSGILIPDLNLQAAVRTTLNKPTGRITTADMLTLTALDAQGRGIKDLTGLNYALNLITLNLSGNQVSDLTPLGPLTRLQFLYLDSNGITDVGPLAAHTALQWLLLQTNNIQDIRPLSGLNNLSLLYLTFNKITDVTPLANLRLVYLSLRGNQVSDLAALQNLGLIQNLYLDSNRIGDILPLVSNTGLGSGDTLFLGGNPLNGLAICDDIAALRARSVTVFDDNRTCAGLADRFEPNVGFQQAVSVAPGQVLGDLSLIAGTGSYKDDWFKFTLTRPAEISLEAAAGAFERKTLAFPLTLYRMSDLIALGMSAAPLGSGTDLVRTTLTPDTYAFRVAELGGRRVGDYAVSAAVDYFEPNLGDDTAGRATPIGIIGFNNTGATSVQGPGGAIADVTVQQFQVTIPAGAPGQRIRDLNVRLGINHTYDGDLLISLRSPAGTQINLVSRRGGSGQNFVGTTLDDEAAVPIINGVAPFSGSFRPDMPLSAFDGQSPGGIWTLIIADQAAIDFGTLNSWSLDFELDGDPGAAVAHTLDPVYSVSGQPGPIADLTTQTFSATVSGLPSSKVIVDLDVSLDITHTFDADLVVTLRSPAGTLVTLANRRGGGADNFSGTIFDDEAINPIATGVAPFTGSFRPESPLSVFDGENPQGTWTLSVQDAAGGDVGYLHGWKLRLSLKDRNDPVDADWYSFTLQQINHVRIKTNTFFGDSKIELFGPNSTTDPVPVTYPADDNTQHFIGLAPGQYFVRVTPFPTNATWNYGFKTPSYSLLIEDEGGPDQFEDDDVPARATPLPSVRDFDDHGPRRQTHNFHDAGDEDWLSFVAPSRHQHPTINITDLGSRAFPVVEVYAADATTLLGTANGSISIDFNTQDNQLFYIRIRNADPNIFGYDTTYGVELNTVLGLRGTISGNIIRGSAVLTGLKDRLKVTVLVSATEQPFGMIQDSGIYSVNGIPYTTGGSTYPATVTTECGVTVATGTITVKSSLVRVDQTAPMACPVVGEIHVDFTATVNGNGSPALPFNTLHAGQSAANPGNTIYIKGVKTPEVFMQTERLGIGNKALVLRNENSAGSISIGKL